MTRKTKQQAQETRQHILDVTLHLFSRQGVSSASLAEIAKAASITRNATYWHFKNKSDLLGEIRELAKPSIDELETEYQTKFSDDPLSVLRETLIYVLEVIVTEGRQRLLLEIILHKCGFIGEMTSVQLARRHPCIENCDHIEQTLRYYMDANVLPENLNARHVTVLLRGYITRIIENWLFVPRSFDLRKEAREYVAVLLEMCLICLTLRLGVAEIY